jgi:hypothetical protein
MRKYPWDVRIPRPPPLADEVAPQKLRVGHHWIDKDQDVGEVLEIASYLETYLSLVNPDEANDLKTQYQHSKGSFN